MRAGLDGRAPEPLEHELEERRLDPAGGCRLGDGAVAALGEPEPAGGGRLDHRLGERRLDLVGLLAGGQAAVPLADGAVDRLARRLAVEVVDADVVVEQRRDAVLEAVELRPGVLAQREHEVHAQVGLVDEPRELDREGAVAVLARVVEEVLLELVEHDEQRPHPLGPAANGLEQRLARPPARQLLAAERLDAGRPHRLGERATAGRRASCRTRRPRTAPAPSGRPRSRAPARAGRARRSAWRTEVLPTPLAP